MEDSSRLVFLLSFPIDMWIVEMEVEVPRMRIGKKQTIKTLINEETLLLAKFLRNERKTWIPRITGM